MIGFFLASLLMISFTAVTPLRLSTPRLNPTCPPLPPSISYCLIHNPDGAETLCEDTSPPADDFPFDAQRFGPLAPLLRKRSMPTPVAV